jgi:hypothetical protein
MLSSLAKQFPSPPWHADQGQQPPIEPNPTRRLPRQHEPDDRGEEEGDHQDPRGVPQPDAEAAADKGRRSGQDAEDQRDPGEGESKGEWIS